MKDLVAYLFQFCHIQYRDPYSKEVRWFINPAKILMGIAILLLSLCAVKYSWLLLVM